MIRENINLDKEVSGLNTVSNAPVSFKEWKTVLDGETELTPEKREQFRHGIVAYLHHLKVGHDRASLASAKAYIDGLSRHGLPDTPVREALRWFFKAATQQGQGRQSAMEVEDHSSPIICRTAHHTRPH